MAADPALRSLPYWESLEPVLPDAERPAAGEPDPRLARTEMALGLVNALMPLFERMHEMTVEHVHEEIQLLAIDFSSMLFETTAPMPSWRDYYLAHDQTPHYAYLKRVLQVLTWLRGGDRWVLKSPQHIEQFGPLLATFPDATFVVTHRDPIAVTASVDDDARLHGAHEPGGTRPAARSRATGRTVSSGCCARACATATCCRPRRPSTSHSTSSWPTTSRWSSASTRWPDSR